MLDVSQGPTTDRRRSRRASTQRKFLPEVQALRALAVALVIVYHLEPRLVPGGFIGVDVFFVISGFLISGHMLREVRETGRLSLARFWANRARRILPAGLLVIGLTSAVSTWVIASSEWLNLQRQALASIFYVQNWLLARDSVDYLAADNAPTPFQHFWSLAVEEQFYLLWPLVVVVMAALAVRTARAGRRPRVGRWVFAGFGVLVAASFVWSVLEVQAQDPSAYFVTTTRLWELGAGGMLAVVLRHTERFALARAFLALAGLGTIAAGAFLMSSETPFPGVAALVPVLGTVAVIAAGRTHGAGSLTWLVDRSWVQWLGNVSYSAYLWHFPVIVFFVAWADRDPRPFESVGLLALALVAAQASYTLVEQPLRTARWARRGNTRVLVAAAVAMAVTSVVALVPGYRAAQEEQEWVERADVVTIAEGSGFGAEAVHDGIFPAYVTDERVLVPNVADLGKELAPMFSNGCTSGEADGVTKGCTFGDTTGEHTIALVGDSHMRMLGTPLVSIAEKNGWRVRTYLHNSCPFALEPRTLPGGPACVEANQATLEDLLADPPDVVVTTFYSGSEFRPSGSGRPPGVEGLRQVWDELEDAGSRVIVIADAPRPRGDVTECVADHQADPARCDVSRAEALDQPGARTLRQAVEESGRVELVDLTDYYCDSERCPAVVGNVLVYRDGNHVTDTYARSLQPYLAEAIGIGG
ncbi:acyltransferase family protein [Promicromonospora sp. NPDC050249]|uniref:acyltransferase family protein n=1 Tax=Promicromonospora sp. NPDC050249 TaxID=3154743 RepID=UPI0033F304DB